MELEQQRCRALQEERDEARAGQLSEHRQLETLKVALEGERQAWAEQERQLEERHRALRDDVQAQLEQEKVRVAGREEGAGAGQESGTRRDVGTWRVGDWHGERRAVAADKAEGVRPARRAGAEE